MSTKIPTKRQRWAMKRNFLLLRLRGAKSIFSYDNFSFMNSLLSEESFIVSTTLTSLDKLIEGVSKSTYKE